MSGDEARITRNQQFNFSGDANLAGRGYFLTADKIQYLKQENELNATGKVQLFHPAFVVQSEQADLAFNKNQGRLLQNLYYLPETGQRGRAAILEYQNDNYELHQASYSSCSGDKPDWELRASYLNIRPASNTAIAHNVRLQLANIPVMYIPWISVPMQGRKSGLLAPEFNYSDVAGADIKMPYYLNLAPQYDATLTPRWIQQRGVQLANEIRWLSAQGRIDAQWEYMPRDLLYQQQTRQFVYWKQHRKLGNRKRADLLFQYSSDANYLKDLGSNLASASQTWLEKRAQLSSYGKHHQSQILVQDFQPLALAVSQPYQRLPAASLDLFAWPGEFATRLQLDYTYFHQPEKTDYHRIYAAPAINWQFERPWAYINPSLKWHYHQFSDNNNTHQYASVPDTQLHSGLFLDRLGKHNLQTLEPELHWIWKPGLNQSASPVFDARALPFRPNYVLDGKRYSGLDRSGDTHFIASVLGYRLARLKDHQTLLYAQTGHLVQINDETAQLMGETVRQSGDNPTWLNLLTRLGQYWDLNAYWVHEPLSTTALQSHYQIDYKRNNQLASVSYFSRNQTEQARIAGLLPLAEQWQIVGRLIWSIPEQRFPEALAGFQYNNCCWNLRITASRFQRDEQTIDSAIGMQLELKGFSSLGQRLDKRFTRELLGYNSTS